MTVDRGAFTPTVAEREPFNSVSGWRAMGV
jgi:hypothetical protein